VDPISNKKAAEFKESWRSSVNKIGRHKAARLVELSGTCWSFTGKTNGTKRALAMKTAFLIY
jgi:hypothetical protein